MIHEIAMGWGWRFLLVVYETPDGWAHSAFDNARLSMNHVPVSDLHGPAANVFVFSSSEAVIDQTNHYTPFERRDLVFILKK
jgi:hypothetical protein